MFDGVAEPDPGPEFEFGSELELWVEVGSPDGRSRGGFGIGSV